MLLLATATSALAGNKTDVVVLKNGDRLTCDIKGLSSGVLYVSLDYVIGTISVEWSQVVRIESVRTFILKTENGSVYQGTLETEKADAAGPMTIKVVEGANQTVVLEQSHVIRMDPTSEEFWQRFNGTISSGLTYSKGNQATQYNFSSETEYLRERWSAQVDFNSNLASSSGDTVSTRNQLRLYSRHLLPRPHYFYGGVLSFLQSSEQGIRVQTSLGGGIGRFFKNTNSASIAMIAGLGLQRTNYNQSVFPLPPQNVSSALIGIEVKLFRFDKTNLNINTDVFPAISDPGRVYVTTNASYFVKLFGKLSWNVSSYVNVDTRPPAHFSGSDYGTSSGLSLNFGKR
jgi:putative salt-induced outer membrane protein YdiY